MSERRRSGALLKTSLLCEYQEHVSASPSDTLLPLIAADKGFSDWNGARRARQRSEKLRNEAMHAKLKELADTQSQLTFSRPPWSALTHAAPL